MARIFTSSSLTGAEVGAGPSFGVATAFSEGLAAIELFCPGRLFSCFSFLAASHRFFGVGKIELVILTWFACFSFS
jgi:hypothetical protein